MHTETVRHRENRERDGQISDWRTERDRKTKGDWSRDRERKGDWSRDTERDTQRQTCTE